MNEDNLNFLKDGLKYLGFGDTLQGQLEEKVKDGSKEFKLSTQVEYRRPGGEMNKVDYSLEFRRSDATDMVFFNRYKATLVNDLDPTKERSQTFYVDKNMGVTAKEAFNLLEGRSVNKKLITREKEPYNAWLKLDFSKTDTHGNFEVKKFSSGYGYDLHATLKKYPIKELDNSEALVKMLASLEKGNVQAVTFVREGKEEKMHVEANPQYKSIVLYDAEMKKVFQANEKSVKVEVEGKSTPAAHQADIKTEQSQEISKGTKKANDQEGTSDENKPSKKKGKGVGV